MVGQGQIMTDCEHLKQANYSTQLIASCVQIIIAATNKQQLRNAFQQIKLDGSP